jgi:hypothetical protein
MSVLFQLARDRPPIAGVVVSGVLVVAGCGGSSKPNSAGRSASSGGPGLVFSRCMRSHGVPHFPDPNTPGGGFQVNVSGYHSSVSIGNIPGINQQSPAFRAANSACQNLLPGGAPAPGQQHPTSAAVAQARAAAKCMRAHGVPNFPDPGRFMPSNPPAYGTVDNINGAVFLIPGSIDLQAPAVQQAATACQFPGGL